MPLAASFSSLGIEAGDRIALILPPCPEFVMALFAAAKLGAVVVPLNPHLTKPELQYMLRHSEAVAAVAAEEHGGEDFLALFDELLPQLPELQYVVTVGEEDLWYDDQIFQFEDLLSSGRGRDYPLVEVDPQKDTVAILYTAGTMGKPKGVELTHANLLEVAAETAESLELGPEDRVIGVTGFLPCFWLGDGDPRVHPLRLDPHPPEWVRGGRNPGSDPAAPGYGPLRRPHPLLHGPD